VAARARRQLDVVYVGFVLGHGGDAVQMLALANGVKELGARVKVVVPAIDTTVTFSERCEALGVACERTDQITVDASHSRQRLGSLVKLLRTLDAPVVHFHTGDVCLPRTAMLAMEVLRFAPSFVTLHSPYETLEPGSARARFWAATASRRFAAVVSPSEHGSAFQRRLGLAADLVVTVRNSVDVDAVAGGDGGGPRAQLGVGAEDPVVLFSSRLDPQKRPLDAVRAFGALADEFPSAVLVFVGTGQAERAVQDEAARFGLGDRVRLVGYQTNVADWLAAATVWILPTERENFSLAVLEALAAGCPILATTCPGNDEVLVDEHNALTFDVGDVDGATARLRRLLADASLRGRLGQQATQSAQDFRIDRMVRDYQRLYRTATGVSENLLLAG
jgi:glycosyltransferase involved in cell wall biosynthesis